MKYKLSVAQETEIVVPFTTKRAGELFTIFEETTASSVSRFVYASSPNSEKVSALRGLGYDVVAPEIPIEYYDANLNLLKFLNGLSDLEERIFVGTSLGGFWANQMSLIYKRPTLLINPSCNPEKSLEKYNVPFFTRYNYPKIGTDADFPRILILAFDDQVIDPKEAEKLFRKKVRMVCVDKGGHRFQRYDLIKKEIDYLFNTDFLTALDNC